MPKRDIQSVNWEDVKKAHDVPPEGEATSAAPENKAEAPKAPETKPEEKPKAEDQKKEEAKPDAQTPPQPDYEKQLADYKKRAEEAEAKAAREKQIREGEREKAKQLARKLKKVEPDGLGEPEDDEDDPKDVEIIAEQKAREQIDTFKREQAAEVLEEELLSLSDNPTERELIKTIFNTELNPNGRVTRAAIRQGLENAKILANKERYLQEAEQRAREKVAKDQAQKAAMSITNGSGGSQGRPEPTGATQYSPQEMKLLKMVGKDKADGD